MKNKTIKQIRSEIAVLEDFKNDCRQNSRSLETLSEEINPSLFLSAHIHAAIGSLILLSTFIQREIYLVEDELEKWHETHNRRH